MFSSVKLYFRQLGDVIGRPSRILRLGYTDLTQSKTVIVRNIYPEEWLYDPDNNLHLMCERPTLVRFYGFSLVSAFSLWEDTRIGLIDVSPPKVFVREDILHIHTSILLPGHELNPSGV